MFQALGNFMYRQRKLVLTLGGIFFLISTIYGLTVFASLKAGGFFDPNSESAQVAQALHSRLGREEDPLVVLFTAKNDLQVDDLLYQQAVEATLNKIKDKPGVGTIYTYYNTNHLPQFLSKDHKSTYAAVNLAGDDDTQVRRVADLRPLLTSNDLQIRLGGRPAVYQEIVDQVRTDLEMAELMTFPLVGVLLLLIFRSLIAASLPLVIGGMAIMGSFFLLHVFSLFTDVSIFALNVITLLGFGLAIDYSLFMVSRFREELKRHDGDRNKALVSTMQTAGHTVLFSGLTVVTCLLTLLVFKPMFLKSMGLGSATAVLIAMLSSLTVLPAILALLGERVNMLSLSSLIRKRRRDTVNKSEKYPTGKEHSGFWYRTSRVVTGHPLLTLVITLIPLLLVGSPFLRINFSIFDARTLPTNHESRMVDDILTTQFPQNETSPIQIIVQTQGSALDPTNLSDLYDYTHRVEQFAGVKRVDSLVTLNNQLDKTAYQQIYSSAELANNPIAAQAAKQFASGDTSLVSVVYTSQPYTYATWQLVQDIRALPAPHGLHVLVGGEPVYLYVDFLSSLLASAPLAFGLIVVAMFTLLFLMLGSLVVPLKAIVLNILSLSVSFGALVWVFQDGHFSTLLNFTPLGNIDSTMPILIFVSAFGLSMDYEVFLLSRIKEEYDRSKDMRQAIAQGLQKTGPIITSAALLLVVVIGSFTTGEVLFIKQIGVGLGLAIIVDATIVRVLLVPAALKLMGRSNWWAPGPLAALYRRLHNEKPVEISASLVAEKVTV